MYQVILFWTFFFNFFFLILFYYFRKSNVTFNNLSLNAGVKILSHIYGGDYLLPAEDLFPLAVAADLYDIPTLTSTTVAKLAEQCHFWHLPCGSVVSVHEREWKRKYLFILAIHFFFFFNFYVILFCFFISASSALQT